jgi:hypothetical protein
MVLQWALSFIITLFFTIIFYLLKLIDQSNTCFRSGSTAIMDRWELERESITYKLGSAGYKLGLPVLKKIKLNLNARKIQSSSLVFPGPRVPAALGWGHGQIETVAALVEVADGRGLMQSGLRRSNNGGHLGRRRSRMPRQPMDNF